MAELKLVLDLGATFQRARRWCWRWFGRDAQGQCCGCGARLAPDEVEYYGITCERCEGIDFHRIESDMKTPTAPMGREGK